MVHVHTHTHTHSKLSAMCRQPSLADSVLAEEITVAIGKFMFSSGEHWIQGVHRAA